MLKKSISNKNELNNEVRQNRLNYLINSKRNYFKNLGIYFKMSDDLSYVIVFTKSGGKFLISLKGIYDYETKKELVGIKEVKSLLLLAISLKNIKNGKLSLKEKEALINLFLLAWDLRKKIKK